MLWVPSGKAFLVLQKLEERLGIFTVYLDFLESGELGAEVELTELVNALVCAGSLLSELVAGEIENLKTLAMVFLVSR